MRPLRYVALGDSLTEGVGDRVDQSWRGWAALLAEGLGTADRPADFRNLAVSGAQTEDVLTRQTPAALAMKPDVASVLVGVNDTLRCTFDIHAVAARLDEVYARLRAQGTVVVTACLPDPGTMLRLPGALARPLARRGRAVNTVVHALSERHGALHLHAAEGDWVRERSMWSADRLHPSERGHRALAVRFHRLLEADGVPVGQRPSPLPELKPPSATASLFWLATAGTAWIARRCTDLLPQLLTLAVDEARHRVRGTSARLDLSASAAVASALASLTVAERRDAA